MIRITTDIGTLMTVKRMVSLAVMTASLLLCSGMVSAARAQSTAADNWNWSIEPYFWGAGLSGQVAAIPGLPTVDMNASPSDILRHLKFGGMVAFHGNTGRFGIAGDAQYIELTATGTPQGPLYSSADVDSKNTVLTLMGEYQLNASTTSELWLGGGVRYWSVQTDINLAAGLAPARSASGKNTWFDPIVGMRGQTDLGEKTYLTGWAYVGGFGVGSKQMYDVFGGFGYRFSDKVSGIAGYRQMSVDRVDGSFIYDVVQKGMLAGVQFNF